MGQEERRLLPDLGDQVVQVVRGGRPGQRRDPLRGSAIRDQPVVRADDQLALLVLLDRLDGQPQLFLDLVVRARVQVGDPGVHVQDRGHRVEDVLARVLLVVDERGRQRRFVVVAADDVDLFRVLDLVHPVDAGLDRNPGQQVHQPPRGDRRHLRHGLGDIGEIPCRRITERMGLGMTCDHSRCSSRAVDSRTVAAAGNVLDPSAHSARSAQSRRPRMTGSGRPVVELGAAAAGRDRPPDADGSASGRVRPPGRQSSGQEPGAGDRHRRGQRRDPHAQRQAGLGRLLHAGQAGRRQRGEDALPPGRPGCWRWPRRPPRAAAAGISGADVANRSPRVAPSTPLRIAVSTATPTAEPSWRAVLDRPLACPIRWIGTSSSVALVSWLIAKPTPVP